MALPRSVPVEPEDTPSIVAFHILEGDLISWTEVRRAPEGTPGSPEEASASVIAVMEKVGREPFVDRGFAGSNFARTVAPYYYQVRHTLPGKTPSDWYPTDWKQIYPTRMTQEQFPLKPQYPTVYLVPVDSAQKYGQVDPQNVLIRMSPGYSHPDTQIYYDYIPASASVPTPSLTDSNWELLGPSGSTPFLRDSSDEWLVVAFAEVNDIIGPVVTLTVSPDMTPSVGSLNQWQTGDGLGSNAVIVGQAINADTQVERIRVYRRVGDWPTEDATNTGVLSGSFFRGQLSKEPFIFETANLLTDDVVYDIWVPLDANAIENNAGRISGSITVVGSSPAVPRFTSVEVNEVSQGTSESDLATYGISWSLADSSDGEHDVKIYEMIALHGGEYVYNSTEASPVSNTMKEVTVNAWYTGGKFDPLITVKFKLELVDTGANIDDISLKDGSSFVGTWLEV